MASTAKARPMGDVPDALMDLMRAQMKLGQQFYEDMTGIKAPDLTQSWNAWAKVWEAPPVATRTCVVPPPCWMPKTLGDMVSVACGCDTVRVRIEVTNCDRVARAYSIRADGLDGVKVSPATVVLNPMRRATFEATFKVPEDVKDGAEFETLIWIDGCHEHVLRWTIIAGRSGLESTHELKLSDCPDFRHHWYDHFYCDRPCSHTRSTRNG